MTHDEWYKTEEFYKRKAQNSNTIVQRHVTGCLNGTGKILKTNPINRNLKKADANKSRQTCVYIIFFH